MSSTLVNQTSCKQSSLEAVTCCRHAEHLNVSYSFCSSHHFKEGTSVCISYLSCQYVVVVLEAS